MDPAVLQNWIHEILPALPPLSPVLLHHMTKGFLRPLVEQLMKIWTHASQMSEFRDKYTTARIVKLQKHLCELFDQLERVCNAPKNEQNLNNATNKYRIFSLLRKLDHIESQKCTISNFISNFEYWLELFTFEISLATQNIRSAGDAIADNFSRLCPRGRYRLTQQQAQDAYHQMELFYRGFQPSKRDRVFSISKVLPNRVIGDQFTQLSCAIEALYVEEPLKQIEIEFTQNENLSECFDLDVFSKRKKNISSAATSRRQQQFSGSSACSDIVMQGREIYDLLTAYQKPLVENSLDIGTVWSKKSSFRSFSASASLPSSVLSSDYFRLPLPQLLSRVDELMQTSGCEQTSNLIDKDWRLLENDLHVIKEFAFPYCNAQQRTEQCNNVADLRLEISRLDIEAPKRKIEQGCRSQVSANAIQESNMSANYSVSVDCLDDIPSEYFEMCLQRLADQDAQMLLKQDKIFNNEEDLYQLLLDMLRHVEKEELFNADDVDIDVDSQKALEEIDRFLLMATPEEAERIALLKQKLERDYISEHVTEWNERFDWIISLISQREEESEILSETELREETVFVAQYMESLLCELDLANKRYEEEKKNVEDLRHRVEQKMTEVENVCQDSIGQHRSFVKDVIFEYNSIRNEVASEVNARVENILSDIHSVTKSTTESTGKNDDVTKPEVTRDDVTSKTGSDAEKKKVRLSQNCLIELDSSSTDNNNGNDCGGNLTSIFEECTDDIFSLSTTTTAPPTASRVGFVSKNGYLLRSELDDTLQDEELFQEFDRHFDLTRDEDDCRRVLLTDVFRHNPFAEESFHNIDPQCDLESDNDDLGSDAALVMSSEPPLYEYVLIENPNPEQRERAIVMSDNRWSEPRLLHFSDDDVNKELDSEPIKGVVDDVANPTGERGNFLDDEISLCFNQGALLSSTLLNPPQAATAITTATTTASVVVPPTGTAAPCTTDYNLLPPPQMDLQLSIMSTVDTTLADGADITADTTNISADISRFSRRPIDACVVPEVIIGNTDRLMREKRCRITRKVCGDPTKVFSVAGELQYFTDAIRTETHLGKEMENLTEIVTKATQNFVNATEDIRVQAFNPRLTEEWKAIKERLETTDYFTKNAFRAQVELANARSLRAFGIFDKDSSDESSLAAYVQRVKKKTEQQKNSNSTSASCTTTSLGKTGMFPAGNAVMTVLGNGRLLLSGNRRALFDESGYFSKMSKNSADLS